MLPLFILFALFNSEASAAFDCTFSSTYPRQFVAADLTAEQEAPLLSSLDGRLDKPAWLSAPFSVPFVDISTSMKPSLETRVKLRWSSQSQTLYIGAELIEPATCANITSTCHCIDPAHDQVIFHDNDFEVFVDADGSTHMYKEYEINAYNATWILQLDKPYDDGGFENSTRVFGKRGFDMPRARSGVRVDGGKISDPRAGPTRRWTVEIAMSLSELVTGTTAAAPVVGDMWRINFSRVRWNNVVSPDGASYWREPSCVTCPVPGQPHEDNWVWSPQGAIAMHRPERWGILQFGTVKPQPPAYYAQWPIREVLRSIYYAEHAFAAKNDGRFTLQIAELLPFVDSPAILDGTCAHRISIVARQSGFEAHVISLDGVWSGMVTDDRLMQVVPIESI
jgi:hypothetical protein